jgi:hypothetical protein
MKRAIVITCSLLLFVAGLASVWADCKQVSFGPEKNLGSRSSDHGHGHHSDSDHKHSHGASIHCPSLDDFLPGARFRASTDTRAERLLGVLVRLFGSQTASDEYRSFHGPPGSPLNSVHTYLLFSVLRI